MTVIRKRREAKEEHAELHEQNLTDGGELKLVEEES